jgi:hypothetical protein
VSPVTALLPAEVQLLYTEGCPNWETTAIRLSIALQVTGRDDMVVDVRRVDTAEQAERLGFTGSPMVRLDGVDPFALPGQVAGLACRLYRDGDDVVAGPTVGQLVDALLDFRPEPSAVPREAPRTELG